MSPEVKSDKKQVLVKEGLFHLPASPSEKPYLIGSKCHICGYVAFPRRAICPVCVKQGTMEEVPLSRRGRINSFTVAQVAPSGFKAPYIVGYVDLPEGPRIFSMMTGCEPSERALKVGEEVELVIEKISEDDRGNEVIGYKFRPIR